MGNGKPGSNLRLIKPSLQLYRQVELLRLSQVQSLQSLAVPSASYYSFPFPCTMKIPWQTYHSQFLVTFLAPFSLVQSLSRV